MKSEKVLIRYFLQECASGKIPPTAPKGKVKEERVFRTIEPVEGCGEGCAPPE